jgi:hypothetical protein
MTPRWTEKRCRRCGEFRENENCQEELCDECRELLEEREGETDHPLGVKYEDRR